MPRPLDLHDRACLALADGSAWSIAPVDERAASVVSLLTSVMQLRPRPTPARPLLVHTGRRGEVPPGADVICCPSTPDENGNLTVHQLRAVTSVFLRAAEAKGGLMLHGALVERGGVGVILAGPSGRGKTTASNRLPPPWRALCDDATLVVRDGRGGYRAHPWPSWARFMNGGDGGSWDCSASVRLGAIIFLIQDTDLEIARLGPGQATCLLVESSKQVWRPDHASEEEARADRLQRLDTASQLVRTIPCSTLRLNLDGTFWHLIERELERHD